MKAARTYLMIRREAGDWDVSIHRDLESLEAAWQTCLSADASVAGVLHVGFWRPDTAELESVAVGAGGQLIVSEAARYALPPSHTKVARLLGAVDGMNFYLVASGWGYTIPDSDAIFVGGASSIPTIDVTHPFWNEYEAKADWVRALGRDQDLARRAYAHGVVDEATYIAHEPSLPDDLREALGWERYLYYVGILPSADSILDTLRFAPAWLLDKKIRALTLSVRASNGLRSAGAQVLNDLAPLGSQGVKRVGNLGFKSVREISTEVLALFVRGPWLVASPEAEMISARRRSAVASAGTTEELRGWSSPTLIQIASPSPAAPSTSSDPPPEKLIKDLRQLLEECVDLAPERHREILRLRMGFDGVSRTLDETGKVFGVTRERIRQIEAKSAGKISTARWWKQELEMRLDRALLGRNDPLPLHGLEILDPWFTGIEELKLPFRFAIKHFCAGAYALLDLDGQTIVSKLSISAWDCVVEKAREMVQGFAGRGASEAEVRSVIFGLLPTDGAELRAYLWRHISQRAHFIDTSDERTLLSFGRSVERAVEAVLNESDVPLHYSVIAERCRERLNRDVDVRRAHNAAGAIGMLFGPGVYGLQKHFPLSDAECRALITEVRDIIAEGAEGRQWHARELALSLEERGLNFGEKLGPYIVSQALRQSDDLVGLKRMVWTARSTGAHGAADRIDVRQAIIALLVAEGSPMSAKEIRDRLTAERGVNCFFQIPQDDSLIRVSPGVWGLPERDIPFTPEQVDKIVDLVREELIRRGKGLHISEVGGLVRASVGLSLPEVDPMLLIELAQRSGEMSLARGQLLYLSEWGEPRRKNILQAVREVFETCGEAGLTLDEVEQQVESKLERPVGRTSLPGYCGDVATYSVATNRWIPND